MSGVGYIIGATIAGLGTSGVHVAGASLRLSTDDYTLDAGPVWYSPNLVMEPRAIRTECEPLEGLTSQATITLQIVDIDTEDQISSDSRTFGKSALEFFWAARREATAWLTEDVNAATGVFNVTTLAGTVPPAAGDLLFVGRERVYVDSVFGSPVSVLNVTRGVLGTEAEPQDGRDPLLYAQNPLPIDREVTLFEVDLDTDLEVERFHGIVEFFEPIDGMSGISVTCRDLLGRLAERDLGEGRFEAPVSVREYPHPSAVGSEGVSYQLRSAQSVVAYRPLYADNDGSVGTGGKVIALDIDGCAVLLQAGEVTAPLGGQYGSWGYAHSIGGGTNAKLISGILPDIADGKVAYEILIGDADNPHSLFRDEAGVRSDHPANLIRCILASTGTSTWPQSGSHTVGTNGAFDWLPAPWGLSVADALINHASFDAVLGTYPTKGLRYRNFYLGAGKELEAALDVLFALAKACNSYLYLDALGRISMRHFRDPGRKHLDATLDASNIRWIDDANDQAEAGPTDLASVYAIKLELAQQGPGGDPARVMNAGDLGLTRVKKARYLAQVDTLECTRVYGDPVTHSIRQDLVGKLGSLFKSRYQYTQGWLPQYDIETTPNAPRITAGMWIELTHSDFFDDEHQRGVTRVRCFVLAGDWTPEAGTQKLRVVDWSAASSFDKLLAPSWKVESVTNQFIFDIEAAAFSGDDAAEWIDGTGNSRNYAYTLWSAAGVRLDTAAVEGAISGTTVTLPTAWIALDGGKEIVPSVGDIVRVDQWSASNDWYTGEDFAFFGDSAGELTSNTRASDWSI